jgi:DNA polymerase-3 subunit epsilon
MIPKLTFIDIETTGYSSKSDKILEISAIVTENLQIKEIINTVINPHDYLSPWIKRYTNITEKEAMSAPDFYTVVPQLKSALEGSIFVAHNADFDYRFVKDAFAELHLPFDYPKLCSVKMFRHLYKSRKASLDTVIDYFGFDCENRHRAYDDAKIILDMFLEMHRSHGEEKLLGLIDHLKQDPKEIDNKLSKNLPDKCGVYIFYDKQNNPLYIGKSKSIKSRVNSHISDALRSGRRIDMIEASDYVHYIETKGELGALLKEAQLIKEQTPIYNKKLRRKKGLVYLEINKNDKGYYFCNVERAQDVHPEKFEKIVGLFINTNNAKKYLEKIVDEYLLCNKLMGLEINDGKPCFRGHLNKCSGACAGKESPEIYNKKFLEAIEEIRYKKWPFDNPVCVIEKNSETYESDIHIVDKWCYLGTFSEHEISGNLECISSDENLAFDLDIYSLLRNYFETNRIRDVNIVPLNELRRHINTDY